MIRAARPADVERILELIHELADYEQMGHEVDATAISLQEHLFEEPARCGALLAVDAGAAEDRVVGYALYFSCYSTFKTRPALFLEDLYVTPDARGHGHGKALLAATAGVAVERECVRLDWHVLSWNRPAIAFYESLDASLLADWRVFRVDGDALQKLAAGG